jgi:catechol 2,3-dioxygenase-like lactoylglutathione lyase family enzyme
MVEQKSRPRSVNDTATRGLPRDPGAFGALEAYASPVPRLDHVNLGVPVDGLDEEAAFLVDLLGYRRVEAGPEAQAFGTLWWFDGDDGAQVHLSADPDHRPAGRAHTAIRLDAALDRTLDRLRAAGHECGELAFDGDRHVFTKDPAGNTWELIGPVEVAAATSRVEPASA